MAYLLIVDDDVDFASAMAMVLKAAGYEVQNEFDTETALASIKKNRPELIILDVMFPKDAGAGFELARVLRKDTQLKNIPILMLTGVNSEFPMGLGPCDIDDTWLPVTDFMNKPVDFDVLQKKVKTILNLKATA